ncbi:MAG: chromate transporter [Oligosphaeraceae bacterium]|nr:chromate transporter [Oligosphaeraceae bacterium]
MTGNTATQSPIWILFREFFKIALFVVGGGYAILLVAEETFGKKYRWLREGELSEMLTLIQAVPGLTAGNIAIYIGYRTAGFWGALAALTGVALPSFLVITLIALGFAHLPMQNHFIQGAFIAVRTAITGLMLATLLRVWRQAIRSRVQLAIFLGGLAAVLLFHTNPGWLILFGLVFGPLYCLLLCRDLPAAAREEKSTP